MKNATSSATIEVCTPAEQCEFPRNIHEASVLGVHCGEGEVQKQGNNSNVEKRVTFCVSIWRLPEKTLLDKKDLSFVTLQNMLIIIASDRFSLHTDL